MNSKMKPLLAIFVISLILVSGYVIKEWKDEQIFYHYFFSAIENINENIPSGEVNSSEVNISLVIDALGEFADTFNNMEESEIMDYGLMLLSTDILLVMLLAFLSYGASYKIMLFGSMQKWTSDTGDNNEI